MLNLYFPNEPREIFKWMMGPQTKQGMPNWFLASVVFLEAVLFQVRAYFGFSLLDVSWQEIWASAS